MAKNWMTFSSFFEFRPQAPLNLPPKSPKNIKILSKNENFGQLQVTFLRCTDGCTNYGYPSIYKCRNLSEY